MIYQRAKTNFTAVVNFLRVRKTIPGISIRMSPINKIYEPVFTGVKVARG